MYLGLILQSRPGAGFWDELNAEHQVCYVVHVRVCCDQIKILPISSMKHVICWLWFTGGWEDRGRQSCERRMEMEDRVEWESLWLKDILPMVTLGDGAWLTPSTLSLTHTHTHTHPVRRLVGRCWDGQDVLIIFTNQLPASLCNKEREWQRECVCVREKEDLL